jgi:hypothetical protein
MGWRFWKKFDDTIDVITMRATGVLCLVLIVTLVGMVGWGVVLAIWEAFQ